MAFETDFHARRLSLIKSARSLEQDKTRTFDEKINALWPILSAARGGKSCAAEESILRWLLKNMDGKSEDAERLRRYPLTWTTLGCLFERISFFSLSNTLTERRFISNVQQSAKDISTPADTADALNGDVTAKKMQKRKRERPSTFNIDQLRSTEACVESATELFNALDILITRVNGPMGQRAEDIMIGAEHVKTLFRTPAQDAKELIAPLLSICGRSLDILENGLTIDQQKWIKLVTTIWNLHLGSKDDPDTFSRYLYPPALSILAKLKGLIPGPFAKGGNDTKRLWVGQLEQLLLRNLINPAKTSFVNSSSEDLVRTALVAVALHPVASAQILWDLAVRTRRSSDDTASKKIHISWTGTVFSLVMENLETNESASPAVISNLLDSAIEAESSPDLRTLRQVCRKYAFSVTTDWALVAKIVQCEPDVFVSDAKILQDLLKRVTESNDEHEIIVLGVINPLMNSFSRTRDMQGFVKKWQDSLSHSNGVDNPWFDPRVRRHFASILQQNALSTQQLSKLIDEVDGSDVDTTGASLVILDAICDGVTEEDYEQLGLRLFNAALRIASQLPPKILAMKWRIAGTTASQVTSDHTHQLWEKVRISLVDILTTGSLSDPATLEAFSCCCQLWLADYPGGTGGTELPRLACSLVQRVIDQVEKASDDHAINLIQYLDLAFSCRLAEGSGKELLELTSRLFRIVSSRLNKENYDRVLKLLYYIDFEESDPLEAALITPIINDLEVQGWSRHTISYLTHFPVQALIRERRKRIMSSWKKWRSVITARAASNAEYAQIVLYLLLMVMLRPTSYQNMEFNDLLEFCSELPPSPDILALLEELVELTISQLAGNPEDSLLPYFQGVSQYVKDVDSTQTNQSIHLGLLKSIVSGLKKKNSPKLNKYLDEATPKLLGLVQHSLTQFATDWKKIKNSPEDNDAPSSLATALSAVDVLKEEISLRPIKLSSKTVDRLIDAAQILTSKGLDVGWKLRTFLARNQTDSLDLAAVFEQLSQPFPRCPANALVYDFVDATVRDPGDIVLLQFLRQLIHTIDDQKYSNVTLIAIMRAVEKLKCPTSDLATIEISLVSVLGRIPSVDQFKIVTHIIRTLLDKHPSCMTQSSIDFTLTSVVAICSPRGPKISGTQVAGEIFHGLYQILATVIKRHRLRLEGHYHMLLLPLQALLRVVLATPSSSAQADSSVNPPWLDSHLRATHAAHFTRLLTLVCEPSAASVTHGRRNHLDSATNVAKRSAGQHMFWILALYIKLQLEEDVSRDQDVRQALEPGVYSILNVTTEGGLKTLNEAVDASGRAIFSKMYREYKKFGKWSGV